MTDEKYVFVTDVRDKKRTARGAFNKRTHAGKGGAVKFPSDFLGKKELNAMNGVVKTYNINSPMTWKEFKGMPEDIQALYIKAIREKYRVSDACIFEMLGTAQSNGSRYFLKLGLGQGRGNHVKNPDMDGWYKWINGISEPKTTTDAVLTNINDPEDIENAVPSGMNAVESDIKKLFDFEEKTPLPVSVVPTSMMNAVLSARVEQLSEIPVVPTSGTMTFVGCAKSVGKALERILGDGCAKISVEWTFGESE